MKHIWRIITFTKELWPYYLTVSIFSIALALVNLIQPLLSGWLIDAIQTGNTDDVRHVVFLVLGIFASDFAGTLFSNIGGYYGDVMSAKLHQILASRYFEHLLKLPQSYFDKEMTGKLVSRLNRSIYQISNFMQTWSNNFLQFIFTTVFALIVVAYYSIPVAIMLFALYPIFIWLTVRTSGKWMEYQEEINRHYDIAGGRFNESVTQVKVVKSYVQETLELRHFTNQLRQSVKTTYPQSKFWHKRDVARRLILNLIFLAVYMYIFLQAAWGHLSAGQAVALILYASQIRIPIFTISYLVENTQRAVSDSKDYFELMAMKPAIEDEPNAKALRVHKGAVEFKNIDFSYGKEQVLHGITFTIQPDTKVALVGESGEGKTTITNLLMRLYEPQSGEILIDDQNINEVTQASLRQNIGVVFQEPALFSGTIRENIAYGNTKATNKQVEAAAKAANAHEFVSKFEKKYDTEIGERGLKLSGGQKQRIAIARALLKDAPILILDEATSSLDSKSEAMVQEALQRLMKGRTTLIIAHRLSTISHVDQIITIAGGKVDEIGSPVELARTDGIYAQLLKLQHGKTEVNKQKLASYEIKS